MATRIINSGIKHLEALGNSKFPSLKNIKIVLGRLGNPHLKKLGITVLIGGTNGKGSVAKSLSTILSSSGYNVGLYTSPHIFKINERIQINNKNINNNDLNKALDLIIKNQNKDDIALSYFEMITTAAIVYFSKMKNDINIFEVGLGGRFDATNVIDAKIGIITNISKDHTEYLGNKISEIASEKAGIIKKDTILITSAKNKGLKVIKNWSYKKTEKAFIHGIDFKCIKIDEIFKYKSEDNIHFKTNLKGSHQAVNLSLSIKACEVLNEYFKFEIDKNKIIKSLKNLKWPARFQIISRSPDKILDVAHNVSAIKNLVKNIKNMYPNKKFNVMISMLKDKKAESCLRILLPHSKKIYFFDISHERSIESQFIIDKLNSKKIVKGSENDIEKLLNKNENLLITGSIYFVGERFKKYKKIIKI